VYEVSVLGHDYTYPRGGFPGLYAAKVEKVDDPDHQGRIQVSIPAIFDETKQEHFAWARPCLPYGHFFVPAVGDKVWVAFENGDPSTPVWLGAYYPQNGTPSEAAVSPPVKRVIKSAKGHLVILDDTDGQETVIVQDNAGNKIQLDANGITIDAGTRNVVIKAASVDVKS
jgi:uncharacterized protein involved in type VI secretion and phage assembly